MTGSQKTGKPPASPRAIIHKNVLDAARDDPGASAEELANGVPGVTVEVVTNILEEYGDPAEQSTVPADGEPADQDSTQKPELNKTMKPNGHYEQFAIEWSDLTNKQQETLRAIREHPEATQADLSDLLGVSSATINTRVNSIEGFDWEQRHTFIDQVLEQNAPADSVEKDDSAATDGSGIEQQELAQRVQTLEEQIQQLDSRLTNDQQTLGSLIEDPELAHKILRACLNSESIGEEEELSIIRKFMA